MLSQSHSGGGGAALPEIHGVVNYFLVGLVQQLLSDLLQFRDDEGFISSFVQDSPGSSLNPQNVVGR